MISSRKWHAAAYHAQHVYALGGYQEEGCEKYVIPEMRWEGLPPLPAACMTSSVVVLESCLYVLGGRGDEGDLDIVQRLHLESQAWEVMSVRLPQPWCGLPCFKHRGAVFLVIEKTLYNFTPARISPQGTVSKKVVSSCGPSYYFRGVLYCSSHTRGACRLEIDELDLLL
jgi:hypothetical protein